MMQATGEYVPLPTLSTPTSGFVPTEYDAEPEESVEEVLLAVTQGSPFDAVAENRLVRKLDFRILPVLCLLYLFAYLDRSNLGNARLQGLPEDVLGGDPTGNLFAWVNSAFFFSYIILHVPATIASKFFLPRIWLGAAAIGWGICSTTMGFANSFVFLIVDRLLLGSFEAAFGPAVPLYLSNFYLKTEIGLRMAYWFGFAAVAGAFSGSIAFIVQRLHLHTVENTNWRILFFIEGIPSIVLGILTLLHLPDRPADDTSTSSSFLTPKEQILALQRMERGANSEHGLGVNREHIISAFIDWRIYVAGVVYFALNCALVAMSAFLPTIIKTFGASDASAQLLTVPPYAGAAIVLTLASYFSDKTQRRGVFILSACAGSALGFILLLITPTSSVYLRFFATLCITSGTYTSIGIMLAWYSHNLGSETKKATGMPMFMAIGQFGSILGSQIFPSTDGPRYIKGFQIAGSLQVIAFFCVLILAVSYARENRRRDRIFGIPSPEARVDTSVMADKAPNFRYIA